MQLSHSKDWFSIKNEGEAVTLYYYYYHLLPWTNTLEQMVLSAVNPGCRLIKSKWIRFKSLQGWWYIASMVNEEETLPLCIIYSASIICIHSGYVFLEFHSKKLLRLLRKSQFYSWNLEAHASRRDTVTTMNTLNGISKRNIKIAGKYS